MDKKQAILLSDDPLGIFGLKIYEPHIKEMLLYIREEYCQSSWADAVRYVLKSYYRQNFAPKNGTKSNDSVKLRPS